MHETLAIPASKSSQLDAAGLAESLRSRIRGGIRGDVRFDPGARALYATDGSNYRQVPIGVVLPHDSDDVLAAISACREFGAPLLCRGGGTSLAGQCCNVAVILDFSKYMSRILEIDPVRRIAEPEQALRALIRLHIEVVLSPRDREITVMLHENHPLPPALRRKINARKKDYVHFLENLVTDVQRARHAKGGVSPRAAAFALLGMINWIYQWYKPEGELQAQNLVPQFTDFVFGGLLM